MPRLAGLAWLRRLDWFPVFLLFGRGQAATGLSCSSNCDFSVQLDVIATRLTVVVEHFQSLARYRIV